MAATTTNGSKDHGRIPPPKGPATPQTDQQHSADLRLPGVLDWLARLAALGEPVTATISHGSTVVSLRVYPAGHRSVIPANTTNTACEHDILAVLRTSDQRLTTMQLLSELNRRNLLHGESTVKMALARLVGFGMLTNDMHARPRGYAIAEDVP